jgi:hypothetical protein
MATRAIMIFANIDTHYLPRACYSYSPQFRKLNMTSHCQAIPAATVQTLSEVAAKVRDGSRELHSKTACKFHQIMFANLAVSCTCLHHLHSYHCFDAVIA